MAIRGPRLEFSVGAFLLLALASLLVLAVASTNQRWGTGGSGYELKARFTQIGQLRKQAPVKIGGVTIGNVADIQLDPSKFDAIVTLAIDSRYKDLPTDTSAGILTGGLLGDSYIGLQPGGDVETLKPGEEIGFTTPAVDLMQMVGKYMFGGGTKPASDAGTGTTPDDSNPSNPSPTEPKP